MSDYRDSPLSAQRVGEVFEACLAHGDASHPTISAQGIVHTAHFAMKELDKYKTEIGGMLAQLPLPFQPREKGGADGWSFLNACHDRDANQWTGLHLVMEQLEQLVLLGLATGQVTWCMPRDLWEALPGGMPYFAVVA